MKFYFRKKKPGQPYCATFPSLDAELNDEVIAELKLERAFGRIARRLFEQHKNAETRDGKRTPVGIDIHGVSFTFILGKEKTKDES